MLILPAFGIISHTVSKESKRPVFGRTTMLDAMNSIAIIGFCVYGHHMFAVGLDADTRIYFNLSTLIIAVPTASKLYN
ncbi:MAG: cbb3-type cytochrome c oxidase subunit I [Gammaproteobacteria bacterium]|nr:cbb3-type cytochrome c oxidase subunit I [Gammaproteobacteria bacterium]